MKSNPNETIRRILDNLHGSMGNNVSPQPIATLQVQMLGVIAEQLVRLGDFAESKASPLPEWKLVAESLFESFIGLPDDEFVQAVINRLREVTDNNRSTIEFEIKEFIISRRARTGR